YWFRSGYTAQFPTPAAVCEFYKGSFSIPSWRPGDTHMTNVLVDWSNDRTTVKCRNASQPSDTNVNTYVINRGGDACPAGHTYNSTTGACEVQTCEPPNIELGGECVAPDPCESTTGSLISHQHKIRDSVLGSESSEPPSTICGNSCSYSFNYVVNNIYVFTGGEPPGVFGSYQYKGTGTSCSGDT